MNIVKKLNTLLRAGTRESAERITDTNALRIYRQEIVDAENLLERRRLDLAGLIATRKDLEKEISCAVQRIQMREQQIAGIRPEERTEELLQLAASDIAATEAHLAQLQQRLLGIAGRIDSEQLTLRKLVAEIREHRREIRILAAELTRGGQSPAANGGRTVAAHVATLRESRAAIAGNVTDSDLAEASFCEASDRVDGDPLDHALATQGRDQASVNMALVLKRLKGMPCPAGVSA